MQRDHRLDALLAQLAQHVAVVADLARVELAFRGLDARPLDRQPVRVLVHLAQEPEVLAVAVVVIARDRGRVAVGDTPWLLLELPPVAVAVVALDLVRCARRPPEETVGEAAIAVHAAALAGFAVTGGGVYTQPTGVSP